MSTKTTTASKFLRTAWMLGISLSAATVQAATISNIAYVLYETGPEKAPTTTDSNLVTLKSVPSPTVSRTEFWRYDDTSTDSPPPQNADGSECRDAAGNFNPSGPATRSTGEVIDLSNPIPLVQSEIFPATDPLFIVVEDLNRNTDSELRELLEVEVTSSVGDNETVRLLETGVDTGTFAGFIQTFQEPSATAAYNCRLSVEEDGAVRVEYTDVFYDDDFSFDDANIAAPSTDLVLDKLASRSDVEIGDFVQYRLNLRNRNTERSSNGVHILDHMPRGFRYQAGSTRIGSTAAADPVVSSDGRELDFNLGEVPANAIIMLSYVAEVSSGTPAGDAINVARARSAGGGESNLARFLVRVDEAFLGTCSVVLGSVTQGACDAAPQDLIGIPKISVLLEDGRYTSTDKDGLFHFEGVCDGTHVVQLDLLSIPDHLEVVPCEQNTRFAGRPYSQFVDVAGGALWRTDFRLQPRSKKFTLDLESSPGQELLDTPPQVLSFSGNFHSGSDELKPDSFLALQALVSSLRNRQVERLEIVGHTDNQRLSAARRLIFADNYELSEARARRAGHYVAQELGLAPHQWSWSGYGPDRPIASNATLAGMARNRRIEFRVFGPKLIKPLRKVKTHHTLTIQSDDALNEAAILLKLPQSARFVPDSVKRNGFPMADPTASAEQSVRFSLDYLEPDTTGVIEFDTVVTEQALSCDPQDMQLRALAIADGMIESNLRTPIAVTQLSCPSTDVSTTQKSEDVQFVRKQARFKGWQGNASATITSAIVDLEPAMNDATAAGADTDWFVGAREGIRWLFPTSGHNPRAPAVRVVIQHQVDQRVELRNQGKLVGPLRFDGTELSADQSIAISIWRGVALKEGPNDLVAIIKDEAGREVKTLQRTIYFANAPVRAELVADQSILAADGLQHPVIAVRFLDRHDRPVRHGMAGSFQVNSPYMPRIIVEQMQNQQLLGVDGILPSWQVVGDEGIARIALEPSTEAGEVVLDFKFADAQVNRKQDLRVWLQSQARDWVVVGFAEGTLGYSQLSQHIEPSPDTPDEFYSEGQISFFAKGRVRGDWLLTMAVDTDKSAEARRRTGLFGVIDPDEFYTLYGDQSNQNSAAPSQEMLYLKLERAKFFALFGDYETGLSDTELARYSRTLTGLKVSYGGEVFGYSAFASDTAQQFVRDEIQGDGTSGLYRLRHGRIVLNSERVRIETRDRFRSERVTDSRQMSRHLDYDIDYSNGTLLFREPVPARDENFNPNIIVVEYEVLDGSASALNAGGRIYSRWFDGAVETGLSVIHEQASISESDLAGVDATIKLGPATELKLEAANSRTQQSSGQLDAGAYVAELEHNGAGWDALVYARRLEPGFGVNQQSGVDSGQMKTGASGRYGLSETVSLSGEMRHQESLGTGVQRDLGLLRLDYEQNKGGVGVGVQMVRDQDASGDTFDSSQLFLAGHRRLWEDRLELSARGDVSVGGQDNSLDYPSRFVLQAAYKLTDSTSLIAAEEYTDGSSYSGYTTRVGLRSEPWTGARLVTTVNQDISEYGPRTYAAMGLSQSLVINDRWSMDLSLDQSRRFKESETPGPVINSNSPFAANANLGNDLPTGDYLAMSGGATYREELWSWNGRLEFRDADTERRYGLVSAFLRQVGQGLAFSSGLRSFQTEQTDGLLARTARLDLSLAWRPFQSKWAVLDRMVLRYESVARASEDEPNQAFGSNSLNVLGNGLAQGVINHFNVNRLKRRYRGSDMAGDPYGITLQSQWSLYYGSKYTDDQFDGVRYTGYSHMLGSSYVYDLNPHWNVGIQGNVLHSANAGNLLYSVGPSVGFSPLDNAWLSLGYNLTGFRDRDFEEARYTAQGPYLKLRFKFDQNTRIKADREPENAVFPMSR